MTLQEILILLQKGEISLGEAHDYIETQTKDAEPIPQFYNWDDKLK